MSIINLTKVLKGKNEWVSLSSDHKRVIAQAKTLKGLLARLKKMGNPDGLIMRDAKDFSTYIGNI